MNNLLSCTECYWQGLPPVFMNCVVFDLRLIALVCSLAVTVALAFVVIHWDRRG